MRGRLRSNLLRVFRRCVAVASPYEVFIIPDDA